MKKGVIQQVEAGVHDEVLRELVAACRRRCYKVQPPPLSRRTRPSMYGNKNAAGHRVTREQLSNLSNKGAQRVKRATKKRARVSGQAGTG